MKETESVFELNGKKYKVVFNLNVMQEIQIEYGTFTKWGELTDGFVYEDGERKPKLDDKGNPITEERDVNGKKIKFTVYETKEVDIKALIFGFKAMLNEAIDIENETSETPKPFYTEKQVGRIVTEMGLAKATAKLNQTVIDSTKEDNPKNE